jgi:hypothetical protein
MRRVVASRPSRLTPSGRISSGTPRVGGWVGLKAGIEAVATRKVSIPTGSRTRLIQSVVYALYQTCTTCEVRRAELLQGKQMRAARVEPHFLFIVNINAIGQ